MAPGGPSLGGGPQVTDVPRPPCVQESPRVAGATRGEAPPAGPRLGPVAVGPRLGPVAVGAVGPAERHDRGAPRAQTPLDVYISMCVGREAEVRNER